MKGGFILNLGTLVKSTRKEKKFTQQELAEKVKLSRSHIAAIESNIYNPSSKSLVRILKALDLNVGILKNISFTETEKED